MKLLDILNGPFPVPPLTRPRIVLAVVVAVVVDALQIPLFPLTWTFFDEVLDLITMGVMVWALGFNLLLLPTFILELLPGIEVLPTWTGCVITVIIAPAGSICPPARRACQNAPGTPRRPAGHRRLIPRTTGVFLGRFAADPAATGEFPLFRRHFCFNLGP
jgi:hypothetical protein